MSDNGKDILQGLSRKSSAITKSLIICQEREWNGSLTLKEPLGGEVCLKEWLAPPRSAFEK